MSNYKFLEKRDSATMNNVKPSGIGFTDNRSESIQIRNLQQQINSSVVVQKQAELQDSVDGVLQCYKEETIGNREALVSEDENEEAIIFNGDNSILYATNGKKPQPESMFVESDKSELKYNNKKYNGYKSKLKVGTDGVKNDCGFYAAAIVEEDLSAFNKKGIFLSPKEIVNKKDVFFDFNNTEDDKYKRGNLPLRDPEVGEAYTIVLKNKLAKMFNVNYHVAPVVLKTPTDCITSEVNAGDEKCDKPYFMMYRGSKAKKGKIFEKKFLSEKGEEKTKEEYWVPIMTSIKRYYKEQDENDKFVNKLKEIPDKLELKITSDNDPDSYDIILYDLDNNLLVNCWDGKVFNNKTCLLTIDYIENNKKRNNLLIYAVEKNLKNSRVLHYKYMGRLNIPDMIEKKKKVKMRHLKGKTIPYFCCFKQIMSFEVECSVKKAEKSEEVVKSSVHDNSAIPLFDKENIP